MKHDNNLENNKDPLNDATKNVDLPTTSTFHIHASKRRKIEDSDSGNSSEYEPSDEEVLTRQISVPSTEHMLKVYTKHRFYNVYRYRNEIGIFVIR